MPKCDCRLCKVVLKCPPFSWRFEFVCALAVCFCTVGFAKSSYRYNRPFCCECWCPARALYLRACMPGYLVQHIYGTLDDANRNIVIETAIAYRNLNFCSQQQHETLSLQFPALQESFQAWHACFRFNEPRNWTSCSMTIMIIMMHLNGAEHIWRFEGGESLI
jgi:hypothetical protein